MIVSNSFLTLIDRIQPLQGELIHADSHTATIEARLEKCFQIKKFGIIGSHSRGTAIRTFSDVDLFVVFSRDDARWGGRYIDSKTFVNRVKSCLAGRYLGTVMR